MREEEKSQVIQICRMLGNPAALDTLLSIMADAKSVAQIAAQTRQPLGSTYKAISAMQGAGFVVVDRIVVDSGGRRVMLYRSTAKSLLINLDKSGARLQTA